MICHEFKGGIGTASRAIGAEAGGWTVGVLVQANYGKRAWLRVDGVRVGEAIPVTEIPSPWDEREKLAARPRGSDAGPGSGTSPVSGTGLGSGPGAGSGSIIVVVATDAPLLPHQCTRLAQRAGLGIARMGGTAGHTSGDLFIAFSTGNELPIDHGWDDHVSGLRTIDVRAVGDVVIDKLFDAVIEATEEAILNALVAATTVVGRDGITAHAIPHDRLVEVMRAAGR
jgi:D-aminopeptidase